MCAGAHTSSMGINCQKQANAQMRAQGSGSYCGRSYTRQQYSHYVRRSSLSAPVLSVACAAAPPGAGGPPTAHDTAAPQQEWSQTSPPVGTPRHKGKPSQHSWLHVGCAGARYACIHASSASDADRITHYSLTESWVHSTISHGD